jgi:hypothetical protein
MSTFLENAIRVEGTVSDQVDYVILHARQHDALIIANDLATVDQLIGLQVSRQPAKRLWWSRANFITPDAIVDDLARGFEVSNAPAYHVFVWQPTMVLEHLDHVRLERWLRTLSDTLTLTLVG